MSGEYNVTALFVDTGYEIHGTMNVTFDEDALLSAEIWGLNYNQNILWNMDQEQAAQITSLNGVCEDCIAITIFCLGVAVILFIHVYRKFEPLRDLMAEKDANRKGILALISKTYLFFHKPNPEGEKDMLQPVITSIQEQQVRTLKAERGEIEKEEMFVVGPDKNSPTGRRVFRMVPADDVNEKDLKGTKGGDAV